MCIAGVFGGAESGVTERTKAVFLESAYFNSAFIRKTAKHHGLKTDASFRFERGTDPEMTNTALTRAANLIIEIAGGNMSMEITDVYPEILEPVKIAFSYQYCNDLIGKQIDKQIVKNILQSLGIRIEKEGSDGLLLEVPRYKTDVTRAADVVEEVMRIYGYNQVEVSKQIIYTAFNEDKNYDHLLEERLGAILTANGFFETMNLSLTKDAYYAESESLVKLVNPLSNDLNVMRGSLLYGGLEAMAYNINRKQQNIRFYEIGKTYQLNNEKEFKYEEHKKLGLWITGKSFNENHYGLNNDADFNFLKGSVELVLKALGINTFSSSDFNKPDYDFGMAYTINSNVMVEFGCVSKQTMMKFDLKQKVYYAEFHWPVIIKHYKRNQVQFQELPLYPSVRRDLALLLDRSVKYEDLKNAAFDAERKLLKDVNLFDVYEGEKLGNKKSYALSFTLQSIESTLTDKQIEKVMEKLMSVYKNDFGAELR